MSKIVAALLGLGIAVSGCRVHAQNPNYLDANGPQPWGINIPIENGFINVANGDLHLEIPLGNHPQRGQVSVNESIVYDSRFWHIVPNGSGYKWQAGNGTGQFAGWSVPLKYDGVQVALQAVGSCDVGMTFTDYSGATHQFIVPNYPANCSTVTLPAYALDGSGYSVTTVQNSPGHYTFYINDSNGTTVYNSQLSPITLPTLYDNGAGEEQIDRNGNCYSSLCSPTDTLGHTPIVESQTPLDGNGNFKIYYDVLTTSGATKRYTINVETLLLTTSFHQSDVSEFSNYVYNIQSILLPDGSSYSFSYEPGYGELQTITLPTGGVVSLYWQNFLDSYQNENRWIYSYQGGNGAYQFTPSVVTQCSGSNKTGCQESMTVDPFDANHGYITYLLTLNGGAWDTQEDIYENGSHILSKAITNTLLNSCPSADTSFCKSATWLSSTITKTTLEDSGQSSTVQTDYASPQYGSPTSVRYWDYGVATSGTPTKHWLASFGEIVNGAAFITADAQLDSTNTQISSNTYAYDEQTPTPTSGLPNRVSPLGVRGNLTTVTSGVSTKLTTHFTYDDAGQMLTAKDPKGNTTSLWDPLESTCRHASLSIL